MPIWIFTGLAAIFLACVSGFFSVTGLAALYSASYVSVILMGSAIEFSKVIATFWLHGNYKTSPKLVTLAMLLIVVLAMTITSGGVYGYLTKGHSDQEIPLTDVNLKIQALDDQIKSKDDIINRSNTRINQLDSAVQSLIDQSHAAMALTQRNKQAIERKEIKNTIDEASKEKDQLNAQKNQLQQSITTVEAKLGPVKYLADLFGIDTNGAVKYFTLLMVILLDPFAIIMVVATSMSFTKWKEEKSKKDIVQVEEPKIEEEKIIEEKVEEILEEKIEIPVKQEPIKEEQPKQQPYQNSLLHFNSINKNFNSDFANTLITPDPILSKKEIKTDIVDEKNNIDQIIEELKTQKIDDRESEIEKELVEMLEDDDVKEILIMHPDLIDPIEKVVEKNTKNTSGFINNQKHNN